MEKRRRAVDRRAALVLALAATDDPQAATALAPILLEQKPVDGYGWNDWNPWGRFNGWLGAGAPRGRRGDRVGSPDSGPIYEPEEEQMEFAHSPCLAAAVGYPVTHAPIYRMLARVGRPSDLKALDRFDHKAGGPAGWTRVCAGDDAQETTPPPRMSGERFGLCRGLDASPYRVIKVGALWLRRRLADGSWGSPAWAASVGGRGDSFSIESAVLRGPHISLEGKRDYARSSEELWAATIPPAEVFEDRDGDGVPDRTEQALGTNPSRTDSDGDGTDDGVDGSPLAVPPKTDVAWVAAEAIRYVTRFVTGGPLTVLADARFHAEPLHLSGVVLHRTRAVGATAIIRSDGRLCSSVAVIHALEIQGGKAHVDVSWKSGEYLDGKRRLQLLRRGSVWRVFDDAAKDDLPGVD